jgi:uncharacterized membrane protein
MYSDLIISQPEENIFFFILLSIHVLSAITFVGGSIFIWLILWPESYKMNDDKLRTRLLGYVGHRFAFWTNLTLGLLILSGLLMTYRYILNPSLYFLSLGGELLFVAEILIIAMVVVMYGNNIYHGKLIVRLNEQGKLDEVKNIRKVTHVYSMITMALMILIVIIMVAMRVY